MGKHNSFTPENKAAVTHATYSVIANGESALPTELHGRALEVTEHLATYTGILAELERQAKHQVLVAETGFLYLQKLIDSGVNPWESHGGEPCNVLRMLGSWSSGAARILAQLAVLRGDKDALEGDYEAKLLERKSE